MANWEEIRIATKKAATKAVKKTEELADMAALRIRLRTLEAKRDDRYRALGKLTYRQLKTGESQAEKIAPIIDELDAVRAKLLTLAEEIEAAKAASAARKESAEATCCQNDEPSCEQ